MEEKMSGPFSPPINAEADSPGLFMVTSNSRT
jgi:hypothetical protein